MDVTWQMLRINIWKNPIQAKRAVAYVPDQPNLYPKLIRVGLLQFIASAFRIPKIHFIRKQRN